MEQNTQAFWNEGIVNAMACERRSNNKNRKARPFRRSFLKGNLLPSALFLALFFGLSATFAFAIEPDVCTSGQCLAAATKPAPAPKKNKGKQGGKSDKPATPKTSPAKEAFKKQPAKGATSASSAPKANALKTSSKDDAKAKDDLMQREPEEQELLTSYDKRFAAQEKEAGNVWIRLLGSILTVLILFMGFVRWMLPGLMTRYPEFFENLKRHSQQAAQPHTKIRPNASNISKQSHSTHGITSVVMDNDYATGEPNVDNLEPTYETPVPTRGKMNYGSVPTRPTTSEVRVLGSAELGEQQGLFLVDIPGHRLLLSSTSEGIEVLKEFADMDEWRTRLMDRRNHNRYAHQADSAESIENWESVPSPSLLRSGLRSDNRAFTASNSARRSTRNYVQKPDITEVQQAPDVEILNDYDDTF